MKDAFKRITLEELRTRTVIVYTQEEVELLHKIGVNAVITYINGGTVSIAKADIVKLVHFAPPTQGNIKLVIKGNEFREAISHKS